MDEVESRRQPNGSTHDISSDVDEVDDRGQPNGNSIDETQTDRRNLLLKDAFSDRKSLVRGLCDASLIAANISQLRAVLESDPSNKFYVPLLTLIALSLLLHIVFGIIIIQMWREENKSEMQHIIDEANSSHGSQESVQESIVHQRIPCCKKDCSHCRKYRRYDDLSILVVFFLVVFNVAISGLGLPATSQDV